MNLHDKISQLYKDAGVNVADANVADVLKKLAEANITLTGDALNGINKLMTLTQAKTELRAEMHAEARDGIDKYLESKVSNLLTADELTKFKTENVKSQQKIDAVVSIITEKAVNKAKATADPDVEKRIATLVEEAKKDALAELNLTKKQIDELKNKENELLGEVTKTKSQLENTIADQILTEYFSTRQFITAKGLEYSKLDTLKQLENLGAKLMRENGEYKLVSRANQNEAIRDENNMPIKFNELADGILEKSGLLKKAETATPPPAIVGVPATNANNYNLQQAEKMLSAMLKR